MVAYGMEGLSRPVNEISVVNNTMVNDYPGGRFVVVAAGSKVARLINNMFAGAGPVLSGPGDSSHNLPSNDPGFINRATFDFRLAPASPAIDGGSSR